jgi:hypothetical protein
MTKAMYQLSDSDRHYLKQLEAGIRAGSVKLIDQWNKYRAAKGDLHNWYRTHYDYIHPSADGYSDYTLLIIWIIAVYFLDLIFSWNVVEYIAKGAFHGNTFLVYAAMLAFPLGYIVLEIVANYFTHTARLELEKYHRSKSKFWVWIFWLVFSIVMALIIPLLYIATGLAGVARTGNPIFVTLLIGFTVMAAVMHITLIFSGTKMVAAKHRLVSLWGYKHRKKVNRLEYHKVMKMAANLEGLNDDYQRLVVEKNQGVEYLYIAIELTRFVLYIMYYVANNYHQIPFGEEPIFQESEPSNVKFVSVGVLPG